MNKAEQGSEIHTSRLGIYNIGDPTRRLSNPYKYLEKLPLAPISIQYTGDPLKQLPNPYKYAGYFMYPYRYLADRMRWLWVLPEKNRVGKGL